MESLLQPTDQYSLHIDTSVPSQNIKYLAHLALNLNGISLYYRVQSFYVLGGRKLKHWECSKYQEH